MKFTIYEAKEVEIPDVSYWAKIWDDGTIVTVRKIDGDRCYEFSQYSGVSHTSASAVASTMEKYKQVQPEVFYTEAANVLLYLTNAAGIELHTLNVEGGAYAD